MGYVRGGWRGREKEGVRERRGAGNEAGKVKEESEERRKKGTGENGGRERRETGRMKQREERKRIYTSSL